MFVNNLACATSCGEWSGVEWCVTRVVVRKLKVNYQHEREEKYACMQLPPQEPPNNGLSYP